jgi:glyoxylase-like metal-dependent hydrolase (beta-lactamase superfamily II)
VEAMLFALEVLKAKEGDCLLLHWGTNGTPKIGVIDGGPGNVYEDFLRPRLDAIRGKRALQELFLDFVMVSHVDNDHITGIKKLFAKLKKEVEDNDPQKPIRAERLWHNTFDDIIGNKINAHYQTFSASFTSTKYGHFTYQCNRYAQSRKQSGVRTFSGGHCNGVSGPWGRSPTEGFT